MKKKFNFGYIDFYGNGRQNKVEIEIELKPLTNGQQEFSASGSIWGYRDIVCGGQCLDTIHEYIKNNTLFEKIYKFWKLYHLNGMHPECEHQRALGWNEQAHEEITLYHYKMNYETLKQQKEIENKYKTKFLNGETIQATPNDLEILNLKYLLDTYYELKEDKAKYYTLEKTETKTCGWVSCNEHEKGILSKPCPVCNYKYGTAWKTMEIPANDLEEIKKLFEEN